MSILERIHSREDLLALSKSEQLELCGELRTFLIQNVSNCGGHLASNLGVIEATLAIHKVYDTSRDRLVFDVGHQCYAHKILTGRMEDFSSLRQYGGISGFPRPEESEHDAFIAGHASNAISVALGMARARTAQNADYDVIALLGDGSLTGGMAYEGLNDLGASNERMVILLNDNGMSINRNVGGISRHLALLRLKPEYFRLKKAYGRFTATVPGGKTLHRFTHWVKYRLKRSLIGTTLFEEMGLTYLGPVYGHDVDKIAYLLKEAREMGGPVLVHIITQKGRGYAPAETDPQNYHGVGKFDPKTGVAATAAQASYSKVFGQTLMELAGRNDRICAITAAMTHGTGLDDFASQFPNRFFDVGIAEEHAVSMAAGMAKQGMVPVVALYSTFLQRAYDMLLHDVALSGLHVVFAVDRTGLVGEDGATHHGVFDVGYLRQIPGMTVFCPLTAEELRRDLQTAIGELSGPVAIRYPRGVCTVEDPSAEFAAPGLNAELTIVTYGEIVSTCAEAAKLLRQQNRTVEIFRLRSLKPLPAEELISAAGKTKRILVVEETTADSAVGNRVLSLLSERGVACVGRLLNLGDRFVPHGDRESLLRHCGLDAPSVCRAAQEVLGIEEQNPVGSAAH